MHPILLQLGPITIRYYGLMYVIAISLGFYLLSKEVRRKQLELSTDNLLDLLLWTVPLAIIGARLYYVVFHWGYYGSRPMDILKLWQGGLAIHGGVLAGILVVYIFSRRRKIGFWDLTDALVPSLILGQAIGRIGNLTNGDAFGLPTTLPWGIHFPAESPAGMTFPGQATHPSMIYEMILNLAIFSFLWGIRKRGYRAGFSTAMYFILYAIARSIVSFTRADSLWLGKQRVIEVTTGTYTYLQSVGVLRAAHAISLLSVVVFGVMIWRRKLYIVDVQSSSGRKRSPK
ncbi:prolipoprotein diacylglyceryl transferase [Candidatus Bipolaricaulota bacterium]|nr:prolipoprotein diacylglyceryl transferase [Candidatus Bipolaricaulota bacterium]